MEHIAPEIAQYILCLGNPILRATLLEQNPELRRHLDRPETRRDVFAWLASAGAKDEEHETFAALAIQFIQEARSSEEAQVLRGFVGHRAGRVRLRAYESLLIWHFYREHREELRQVIEEMLLDPDEIVRTAALRYGKRADLIDQLRPLLEGWLDTAARRGWEKTESFELVQRLLLED